MFLSDVKSISFKSGSSISPDLVQVTGGTFQMGSNNPSDYGASPAHTVTVSSFSMEKYEVTYEKWTEIRNWALSHGYVSTEIAVGRNGSSSAGTNNPVTEVNWYDVVKWCNARSEKDGLTPVYYTSSIQDTVYRTGQLNLNSSAVKWTANGYRLPTEAEWEYAAKGGTSTQGYTYSGSNTIDNVAWYSVNSGATTHTVGTKSANELGIYDMSGNALEWCWDWNAAYASTPQTDPKGATSGTMRIMRGGAFASSDVFDFRVATRGDYVWPVNRSYGVWGYCIGFRCVQD